MTRDRHHGGRRRPARASQFAEPLEPRRLFAAGALDTSFSGDGKTVAFIRQSTDDAFAAAVQADGKVLAVGRATLHYTGDADLLVVARYNANGTPDAGFGPYGLGWTNLPTAGGSEAAVDVAVAGNLVYVLASDALYRLTANGGLDPSFDGDGRLPLRADTRFEALAVQPDGKPVLAGSASLTGNNKGVGLLRLNANGSADGSFGGGDGFVVRDFSPADGFGRPDEHAADVLVRSDGKLAVVCNLGEDFDDGGKTALWTVPANGSAGTATVLPTSDFLDFIAGGAALTPGNAVVVGGRRSDPDGNGDAFVARFNSAGGVDTGFGGGDGIVISFGLNDVSGVVVAPDGKLLLSGEADQSGGFGAARLTAAGTPDTTFDGDGVRAVDVAGRGIAADLVRLADGDLVVVGTGGRPNAGPDFVAVRINANGTLQTDYGLGGRSYIDFSGLDKAYNPYDEAIADVLVTADGKTISAGTFTRGGKSQLMVTRHLPNGLVDPTFGGVLLNAFGDDDHATGVDVDAQGRIVVAGYTFPTAGAKAEFLVTRLLPDGRIDESFGDFLFADETGAFWTGYQTINFGASFNARAWDVKVLADGKILVAGGAGNASSNIAGDFAVAKLDANGEFLDTSFSGDGKQRVSFGSNLSTVARGLKVQTNGRIVLAGWAGGNAAVARMLANGSPDNSFSGDGKLTTDWGTSEDRYYGVDVDAAGKIVVAGSAGSNIIAGRYAAGGVLDATFDGDGKRTVMAGRANAVRIQSSGKIVLVGGNSTTASTVFRVVRLNANGSNDGSFGGGDGVVDTIFDGHPVREATAVAFAPGGKMVVGGFAKGIHFNLDFALARYSIV